MSEKCYKNIRHFYYEYQTEFIFGICLSLLAVLSYLLAPLIPSDIFIKIVSPAQNTAIITVTLINTWLMAMHNEGMRVRKILALIMAALSVVMIADQFYRMKENASMIPADGTFSFEGWELVAGDVTAWLLLAYPVELLRPGWLNWKNALVRLLPVLVLGVIDLFVPWDLRWLIAVAPLAWLGLMVHHVRVYRKYSEDNYGSVEETDERWIIRYMLMVLVSGASYTYLCFAEDANRMFTQQWLLIFLVVYTIEQAVFRHRPWMEKARDENGEPSGETGEAEIIAGGESNADYRRVLEQWMEREKPYLKADFRLTDLMQVLPMNRTYLSQFINAEYDCTFYQFVTNYRIEEAKRVMRDHPDIRVQEIAERCGFSSATVFGRIFARETGFTPTEWLSQFDNK